jgi:hypothetical protein
LGIKSFLKEMFAVNREQYHMYGLFLKGASFSVSFLASNNRI